jgi:hypothetical protein
MTWFHIPFTVFQGEHEIQFAHGLSDEQKSITLQFMLKNSLFNRSLVSAPALTTVACEHNVKLKKRELPLDDLQIHSCIWSCLVHSADARKAGQCVINGDGSVPLDRSRKFFRNDAAARKIFPYKASHSTQDPWGRRNFWGQFMASIGIGRVSQAGTIRVLFFFALLIHMKIIIEHRSQTAAAALLRQPCSLQRPQRKNERSFHNHLAHSPTPNYKSIHDLM